MPYITTVLLTADNWAAMPRPTTRGRRTGLIHSTFRPGKMAGLVYYKNKKSGAC